VSKRTPTQTLLLALGAAVFAVGLVCVAVGFARFADADPVSDDNGPLLLFAGGGLVAVVGFGIIAFTRAAILRANGGYRITIEQGGEQGGAARGGRLCPECGRPTSESARFCESCGAAVEA